jgi:Acyl-protein synthetase, LuxE
MTVYEQVLAFIHRPEPHRFDELALDVFRHQFDGVAAYRRYCESRGESRDSIRSIDAIPAVSTLAFKYADLARADAAADAPVFLTSGTTAGRERRGRHVVAHPELYRASGIAHFGAMVFPDRRRMRMLAIHPTADRTPASSLSQMLSWCIDEFGRAPNLCAADRASVDSNRAIDFLADAERRDEPVCILGTTAAFAAVFDALRTRGIILRLAEGSRMMDTGGAKGQALPLDPAEVAALSLELLGIAPEFVINEYGMTELCSQLYDATVLNSPDTAAPGRRVKLAPPWLRVSAVDPATLAPVAAGEPGLLKFFDLANAGSVSAVLTEDIGVVEGNRVRIVGRSAGAEPRGCALAIAEFAEA